MIFISHANPEDNGFAQWLSLQLAGHGYPVWCDLTKLLGGEDFWDDIQKAISERTCKFLFVLSRSSNKKDGALQELAYAKGVAKKIGNQAKDFIIPLRLDDIPYEDVDIRLQRQNHIDCSQSWASGMLQLLKKLEDHGVPKRASFTPDAVCSWWRDQVGASQGVVSDPEKLLSNWFKVENLPSEIYEHRLEPEKIGPVEPPGTFPYPAVWTGEVAFLSFAPAEDFKGCLGRNLSIKATDVHSIGSLLISERVADGPKRLSELLRLAWESKLASHLPSYEMATGVKCFYFTSDRVKDDSVEFIGIDGRKTWRGVVGFKSVGKNKERRRIWHFGISGKPIIRPETLFFIKSHVLFSDDGQHLWNNKKAMAKARRNQCRQWWNDKWRDLLLASMTHLATGEDSIRFPLGRDRAFVLEKMPILFDSPVRYTIPEKFVPGELGDEESSFDEGDDSEFGES